MDTVHSLQTNGQVDLLAQVIAALLPHKGNQREKEKRKSRCALVVFTNCSLTLADADLKWMHILGYITLNTVH